MCMSAARLLVFVSQCISKSPHLEFYLQWSLFLLQHHGRVRTLAPLVLVLCLVCLTSCEAPPHPALCGLLRLCCLVMGDEQAIRARGAPMLAALRALQRSILVHKDTLTKLYVVQVVACAVGVRNAQICGVRVRM